ncbi:hypothetical protein [Terrimonas alba]|uniref:hypothetical protein n=1 Tax=Terrimonas alba TaxID=3349636 RepID=UPI0035F44D2B
MDQLFNPPGFTILDPSVLNRLNKYYYIKDLAIGTPQSFEDTIHVSYPFPGKRLNGQRKYLKIPVDITTTIAGSGFRSQTTPVILTDPRLPNNSAKITVISPTPLIYVKPNTN